MRANNYSIISPEVHFVKTTRNTGVQSKNNEYHIVNKVENPGIYEWILNLIDNVVFVVFALYSRILLRF
jgi:hypothetical protein